jgi:undecaprenyl-diphosphatase
MNKPSSNWLTKSYGWMRNQDLVVLLLTLAGVVGVWAFFILANEVEGGETRQFDERVIRAFRTVEDPGQPVGPIWLEGAVRDVTSLGSPIVLALVMLAVAGFVVLRRQYHAFWFLLGAGVGAGALGWLLKRWFARPRPELVPHLVRVDSGSFPSGHSLLSAAIYLTLGALLARLVKPMRFKIYIICVALVFSMLVGVSRVYLGVHYPTDVLGGWTVGLLWAIGCWLVARFLQRRGAVERAPEAE